MWLAKQMQYLVQNVFCILQIDLNDLSRFIPSYRWHYNIFYVLHLMENAPPPAGLQDNRWELNVDIVLLYYLQFKGFGSVRFF